jgi:hypothetical protein
MALERVFGIDVIEKSDQIDFSEIVTAGDLVGLVEGLS